MAYLDTSVLVAYYCPEPISDAVQSLLARHPEPMISLLVRVEFASALSRKVRMRELSVRHARSAFDRFDEHCSEGYFRLVSIEPGAYELACKWLSGFETSLRGADALHVAVAYLNGEELLTADSVLARSAKNLRVKVRLVRAS
jgi:predicted nucleic acid-binding protein